MSEGQSEGTQKQADTCRARTHGDAPPEIARAPAAAGPENETQNALIETAAPAPVEVEPVGSAGEAMVALLASKAALPRKVIAAIERALEAQKWSWNPATKQRVYEPDYNAQMNAAKLYLEYVVGRPVERELVVTDGKGQGFSLDELMASSALRRALARRLQIADSGVFGKGGGQA